MQLIKKLVDLYIFSNIHVAIAGFSLTKITLLKFELGDSWVPMFVACSIIISYNFIRYYELKLTQIELTSWYKEWFLKNIRWISVLSITSGVGLIYILFSEGFNRDALWLLSPFIFMTFFYAIPLLKIRDKAISFRSFPFVKIFAIAISWAAVSVLFPLYEANFQFTYSVYIEFIQRFLLVVAITIPFDIRDVVVDSELLKTLPQVIGINGSIKLGSTLLFFVVILELFRVDIALEAIFLWVLVCLITALFLWGSTPKRSKYYTSFWVESIPIIWLILLILESFILEIVS